MGLEVGGKGLLGQWGHSPRRENPPRLFFSPSIGTLIPGWQPLADIQEFPAFKRDRLFLHQKKRDTDSQVSSPSKDERHRLAWLGDDGGFPPRRKKPPGSRVGEGREQTARPPFWEGSIQHLGRLSLSFPPSWRRLHFCLLQQEKQKSVLPRF